MTTIIPIELDDHESDDLWDNWDDHSWQATTWEQDAVEADHARRGGSYYDYTPTTSEITQDILIPEGEFDEYLHDEPFEVSGARLDGYSPRVGEITETPDFHRLPASAPRRSSGKHRLAAPPSALRGGRAALVAMAAGAAVVAVAAQAETADTSAPAPVAAAEATTGGGAADSGPGVASSTPTPDTSMYSDQLAQGAALAKAEQDRINASLPPMFVSPVPLGAYQLTSLYAMRWGSFHAGLDFAAPLGTPIHAATDGVVVEAGPASGFGNWIQVKAADGTITVYGHMYSNGVLVTKGQTVRAGQVIGLVGSDGQSTGPHCHFEVWRNGVTKIDPAPWLAEHGVRLSNYVG